MIVCKECGNSAASADGFCSSCGALLEWSGQPVEASAGAMAGGQLSTARTPVAERTRPGPVPLAGEPDHRGPYCSACGVRNPEGRTFCRSCGEVLRATAAAPAVPAGWWRRLLARLRGQRPHAADVPAAAGAPKAGGFGGQAGAVHGPASPLRGARDRARRVRPTRRLALSRFAPVLLAAGLLGVGLGPARAWLTTHAFGLEHRAQARLSQRYADVVPISASASTAAPEHGAKLAIDGIQQTYWRARAGQGNGAKLVIRFPSPQNIDRVGVLSGEPGAAYRTQARPQTIELIAGHGQPVTLSFDDTPGFQNRAVSLRHVTAITVVIRDVYPGQRGQAVTLREIEFFARV
jgi:hypothetical protein